MGLVVHRGGGYGRYCGECGWWCMVVVIKRGNVVNVAGGALWWRLWQVIVVVVHSCGECGR